MRIFIFNLAILLLVGCSSGAAQSSAEDGFWRWFQANETKLFDFERDREKVFDELEAQLHKVNAGLTFEFGPKENGKRDFVISADGIKDVFPSVISLANAAPSLSRWRIIKFRPRRGLGLISLNGLQLSPEQWSSLSSRMDRRLELRFSWTATRKVSMSAMQELGSYC